MPVTFQLISNNCCSFKPFTHQIILKNIIVCTKILSSTTVFNIDNKYNIKHFLSKYEKYPVRRSWLVCLFPLILESCVLNILIIPVSIHLCYFFLRMERVRGQSHSFFDSLHPPSVSLSEWLE